jgi:hypothetical protein
VCGLHAVITVYGVVSHMASHTLLPELMYDFSPSEFLSYVIHQPELSDSVTAQKTTTPSKVSKAVPLHAMEALGGRGGIAPAHGLGTG